MTGFTWLYPDLPSLAEPETADLPMLEMAVQKASGALNDVPRK